MLSTRLLLHTRGCRWARLHRDVKRVFHFNQSMLLLSFIILGVRDDCGISKIFLHFILSVLHILIILKVCHFINRSDNCLFLFLTYIRLTTNVTASTDPSVNNVITIEIVIIVMESLVSSGSKIGRDCSYIVWQREEERAVISME